MCAAWTEVHFRAEHAQPPWTWHRCDPPVLDPTGTHAMILFEVRYAHWAYDMLLFLQREGDAWRLHTAVESMIT